MLGHVMQSTSLYILLMPVGHSSWGDAQKWRGATPLCPAAAAKPPPNALPDAGAPKGAAGDAGAPNAGDAGDPKPGAADVPNPGALACPKPAERL